MWQDIKEVYANAWKASFLLPLLFLIPALVEFAQHIVEINAGMYESRAAAKAAGDDPMRMIFGFAKVLSLSLPTYWFVRLMAFQDRAKAARIEAPAFGLWLVLMALMALQTALAMFGPPLGTLLGLNGKFAAIIGPALNSVWSIFGLYLIAWAVAWPLGNREIGPLHSIKLMSGSFWRTVACLLACVLPLMAMHYALGYLAIGLTPTWLDWPVLLLDSLIVAFLACATPGASFVAARHAALRNGVSLLPA